jgi:RNA polymerase sigma factor (TIGR02999 family)
MGASTNELTVLLQRWREGDEAALHALVPHVHDELRRIAARCVLGDRRNHAVQPTLLVNEAFLRLADVRRVDWQNRAHFFAMAARLIRRVLVDLARARRAEKRGGGAVLVSFDERMFDARPPSDVIRLNDALDELAVLAPRKSQVVELRFFAGLSVEEISAALDISAKTVQRDWEFARAWLQRELAHRGGR